MAHIEIISDYGRTPTAPRGQSVITTNLMMQNHKLAINITAVNHVSDS